LNDQPRSVGILEHIAYRSEMFITPNATVATALMKKSNRYAIDTFTRWTINAAVSPM